MEQTARAKKTKINFRQYGMIIALVILALFFFVTTNGRFGKPMNVYNIIMQNGYVLVLAIGMLLPILTGSIDLSVGSVVAVVSAFAGVMMYNWGMPVWITIIICIIAGLIIGLWQGFWIAMINMPPFIATLGGMLIFRGLTLVILQGKTLAPLPSSYVQISSGYVKDYIGILFGIESSLNITTMVVAVIFCILILIGQLNSRKQKLKYGFEVSSVGSVFLKTAVISAAILLVFWRLALYKGIPYVLLIVGVLALFYNFILTKTTLGRHIYAVGGNAKAAELSGIDIRRVIYIIYVNMAFMSAVAGIVFSARLNSASPLAGQGFEMDAIAACYLGGASASGGIGTITGALVGGLIMGILNNGMSLMGISSDVQQIVKGLVVIFAVAFDIISKNKSSR
ncbi:MAG: sugar ABC transporter permease [Flexilinea sp.]|jgi:putative multiple sugar transport system permease protein|nr:sugar ABC transporter permease [Flexilinea sp.]